MISARCALCPARRALSPAPSALRAAPSALRRLPCVRCLVLYSALSVGHFLSVFLGAQKIPGSEEPGIVGAPEGIRTPNLLIRSQMLYPLSYRRMFLASDFFNPSRQQVLLYGCPWMCASRKTRNLPKIPSVGIESTPFYRMIPGFLCSQNFSKIFLLRPKTFPRTAPNTCFDPAGSPKNPPKIFSHQKNVMRRT